MKESKQIVLHLTLIPGVGPATINAVLQKLDERSIVDIYAYSERDFVERCHVTHRIAGMLVNGLRDTSLLDREVELLQAHPDITWVCMFQQEYPSLLKEIYLPPAGLYVRGGR